MSRPLDLVQDGADWPNRAASRRVTAGGIDWHVQSTGEGPPVLLLHGTGASTHSWRGLLPRLATRARVIAPDLPGHAFTSLPRGGQIGLPAMARRVGDLLKALDASPRLIVGHSAGAAIALRMALDGAAQPHAIVSLNGALLPFPGMSGVVFPMLARVLFLNPFAPRLFTGLAADRGAIRRLIAGTGSHLDDEGIALYHRLFRNRGHVRATIGMMAGWDLHGLKADLRRLRTPVTLVSGDEDKAVPPAVADEVAELLPHARVVHLPGLGHLAHEEDPETIARIVLDLFD